MVKTGLLTAVFLGAWIALTGGGAAAWAIGLPTTLVAARAAVRPSASPEATVPLRPALALAALLVTETLRSTLDVMSRVVATRPRVAPEFLPFESRLERQPARVLFAYCLSLLPGTVTSRLDGSSFEIHVLDAREDWRADLRRLEAHIGRTLEPHRSWPS